MNDEPIPLQITCGTTQELITIICDADKTDYYRTMANEELQTRLLNPKLESFPFL